MRSGETITAAEPRSSPTGIVASGVHVGVIAVVSIDHDSPCATYMEPSSPPSKYSVEPTAASWMCVHATGASGSGPRLAHRIEHVHALRDREPGLHVGVEAAEHDELGRAR